jgi:ribosomal protein L15
MYYNLLEKTRFKYDEALESNLEDIIRDWGRIGFENLTEAAQNGRKDLMLQELDEMIDSLEALTRKGDKKRFVAV